MLKTVPADKMSAAQLVAPLALCQFIASYAGTNMNVAIGSIAKQLGTTVIGVQTAITLFTLVMAALMIPGSKLTDIWGRKFCFILGLGIYGTGAILAAASQTIVALTIGYSIFEGVGSALMIPPIYIIITVAFTNVLTRAKWFGLISAAAGVGAAAGPLLGGLITSGISWRASFVAQVLVVGVIIVAAMRIREPSREAGNRPAFDLVGAILSAVGLVLVVIGVLQSRTYGWFVSRENFTIGGTVVIAKGGISPVWLYVLAGSLVLVWFYLHVRSRERRSREPLIASRLFKNRLSNLGLATQNIQWLILQGSFFVISVFLQEVRHFNAIKTGLILTPATIGLLASSVTAQRLARRFSQKTLIWAGFVLSIGGMLLILALVRATSGTWTFVPGLCLMGIGVGAMLTSSVNVVQSAFPEKDQGEISGLSRSVSNLGSSLGTAIAGSVLVSTLVEGNRVFGLALITLAVIGALGLLAALLLPRQAVAPPAGEAPARNAPVDTAQQASPGG